MSDRSSKRRHLSDVPWTNPDIMSWWMRYQVLAPAEADACSSVVVLSDEEVQRLGLWNLESALSFHAGRDDGADWVWFKNSHQSREFFTALLLVVYGLNEGIAHYLVYWLINGSGEPGVLEYVHHVAKKASTLDVADVEACLGMTLQAAYEMSGGIPSWQNLPPSRGIPLMHEPAEFVSRCLDGMCNGDSFGLYFAVKIFGDIPAGLATF